jgi:class 3 adenylate cyclase
VRPPTCPFVFPLRGTNNATRHAGGRLLPLPEKEKMSTDNLYNIQGKFWYPRFEDPANEREFIRQFNTEALAAGRIGALIVLLVWAGFAWFDLRLDDSVRSSALFFRLAVVTPLLLAILVALFSKHAFALYQPLAVLTIFIIQGSILLVVTYYDLHTISDSLGFALPMTDADGKFLFVLVWLLIIFMGAGIMRLTVMASLLSGAIYIFWNLTAFFVFKPSELIAIIEAPFMIAILPTVWAGSLFVQRYARENFRSTKLLMASMQRSEALLLNILPVPIADRLKEYAGTIADGFESVSVLFADIVAFTQLSERYGPEALVQMLNRIFSEFDFISKKHNVEKIKTIGDAYMLAAGVPETRADHCRAVAECALDMVAAAEHFTDPAGSPIQIRVGIHTGPAIAGVIGAHKFAYDLWGDTVNTASRMESHGTAGKIQATQEIYEILKNDFHFESREEIEIKGKGRLQTWWLLGRRDGAPKANNEQR